MPKPQDIFQLGPAGGRAGHSIAAGVAELFVHCRPQLSHHLSEPTADSRPAARCRSLCQHGILEYERANRLVMRGSRSITVLQRRQGMAVTKPVFAIGDTTPLSQMHTGGPWEVTDTTRPLLLQDKSDDWLVVLAQDGVSNEADRARRMLERNVADSTLQWAQPDEQMQLLQALVTQSAVYIARLANRAAGAGRGFSGISKASASSTPIKFHCVWAAMYRPPQNRYWTPLGARRCD